jgi:general secretion pathway protein G
MKKKKRTLTLLEIMIVIALITLITGVIGYNMRDTLNRGRAFRTEQAKEQLRDMLLLSLSDGKSPAQIIHTPGACIKDLGLAKNVDQLLKDGWNNKFTITYLEDEADFKIESEAYNQYLKKKNR